MLSNLSQNENIADGGGAQRVEAELMPTQQPQRIFKNLNAIVVMLCLMGTFILQYIFINDYITLLLVSMLLIGALEVPGNALRYLVATRVKIKFCFLLCGTLSFYIIILFGLYLNRSCSCNGSV